jgi:hypothetical protein
MFTKRMIWFLPILTIVFWFFVIAYSVHAKDSSLQSQLLEYAGKSYTGVQDPFYLNYDLALRRYMIDRISKRFGIALDPKIYSGFELLEIEAFFRCKKKEESFDIFLKMLPKRP